MPEAAGVAVDGRAIPKQALFPSQASAVARDAQPWCAVAIDAEEDFDWDSPIRGTSFSTACMKNTPTLHEIFGAYGIVPIYLLTYPVLDDDDAVRLLDRQIAKGQCLVGLQLHPWVTPPFGGSDTLESSFSGNLDPNLEEQKLLALRQRFIERFGEAPKAYRAGRYGLSAHTAGLLEKHGFTVDTSLAPRTSFELEGGPDFSAYDYGLFWFGRHRDLLEVPLCRSVVGWGGAEAGAAYRWLSSPDVARWRIGSVLPRLRFAERVTLSPEGNDAAAMERLVRGLSARGQSILVLSFHSSSLLAGRNPYVRSRRDLHAFYDSLSTILDRMVRRHQFRFTSLLDLPLHLLPRTPLAARR